MSTNYNPQIDGIVQSRPIGAIGYNIDGRSTYYDEGNFLRRPFISASEAVSYFNTDFSRQGQFSVLINTGGTLQSDGTLIGGSTDEYWWKDSLLDGGLVVKIPNIDLSGYYTKNQINAFNTALSDRINTADAKAEVAQEDADQAYQEATLKIPLAQKDAVGGVPVIDTVSLSTTISNLRTNSSPLKSARFTTTDTKGDWFYDPADTTSVDDGGTIIVDGSNRRIKRIYNGYVYLEWWDYLVTVKPTPSDPSTWDWAPAISALNLFVSKNISKFSTIGDTFNLANGKVTVFFDGIFGFSNTLIVYPGAAYVLPGGSRLYAMNNGQIICRTPTVAELSVLGAGGIYGSRGISFTGKGILDGANVASCGFLADTIAKEGVIDITITRCNYRKYSTTGSGTSGSTTLVVANATDIRLNDVIAITGTDRLFYSVASISGLNIGLNRVLDITVSNVSVVHQAVGFSGNMAQQSHCEISSFYNDIGVFFGFNTDRIGSTDMKVTGMMEHNMTGVVVLDSDVRFTDCTIQHNFGTEIYAIGSIGGLWDGFYLESMSDAQANGLIPPVGTAPIGSAALGQAPLIVCKGGRATFKNVNYPSNPGNTSWRRFMTNSGDTVVDGVSMASVALLVNPNIAGDYALVEQNISTGNIYLRAVRGLSNMSVVGPVMVCKPDGTTPNSFQASWEYPTQSNWKQVFVNNQWVTWQTGSILDIFRKGESTPRLSFLPGSILFGNGATTTPNQVTLGLGNIAGTMTNGSGYMARRVSAPATQTTAGLPGDFAVGSRVFYFYSGDGTTHAWWKIDASLIGDQGAFTIDATSIAYTKSAINTAYPNAKKGNIIIQDGANMIYIKKDDSATGNWSTFPSVQLT